MHVDDPGTALYILKSGLAKITLEDHQGAEFILRLLYPTDFFGDMALLDGMPRSATITTQAPSVVLTLAAERGRVTLQATVIERRLTQQELAGLTGMRRATVARTLQAFQEAGCIRVDAGSISVLEPELLRREMGRA